MFSELMSHATSARRGNRTADARFSRSPDGRVFSITDHAVFIPETRVGASSNYFSVGDVSISINKIINNPFMYASVRKGVCIGIGSHFRCEGHTPGRTYIKYSTLKTICMFVRDIDREFDTMCNMALSRHGPGDTITIQELCCTSSSSTLAKWIQTAGFFTGDLRNVLYFMYAPILNEYWDSLRDDVVNAVHLMSLGHVAPLSRISFLCVPFDRSNRSHTCKWKNVILEAFKSATTPLTHRLCVDKIVGSHSFDTKSVSDFGVVFEQDIGCFAVPALRRAMERLLTAGRSGRSTFVFTEDRTPLSSGIQVFNRMSMYSYFEKRHDACIIVDAQELSETDWITLSSTIVQFNDVFIHTPADISLVHKHFLPQLASGLGATLRSRRSYDEHSLVRRLLRKEGGYNDPASV